MSSRLIFHRMFYGLDIKICSNCRVAIHFFIIALSVSALTACSIFRSEAPKQRVRLQSVVLNVSAEANDHTPVALDFVVVKDPDLLAVLQKTTASQWFLGKPQILADHPGHLLLWSMEIVPGTVVEERNIPFRNERMEGLLMFAGYATEGMHRFRLDNAKHLDMVFGRDSVQFTYR